MKVFNLQCEGGHGFEGWFGSEDDFQGQLARGLLTCPLCQDPHIRKLPSAPRLNLGATRPEEVAPKAAPTSGLARSGGTAVSASGAADLSPADRQRLQAAWLQVAREVVRNTEDVGSDFADEARRIHHGEAPERGIRGHATPEQTAALLEEGVPVLPLPLPAAAKETLQ